MIRFLWFSWGPGSCYEWSITRRTGELHVHLGRLWITAFTLGKEVPRG